MQFLRTIVIVLSAIVMAGASQATSVANRASTDPASDTTASMPVTPNSSSKGLALGASMLPGDRLKQTYDDFRNSVGRAPATWSIWSDWGGSTDASVSNSQTFPTGALMADLKAHGTVPFIFWQPVNPANLGSAKFKYSNIAHGSSDGATKDLDAYITQYAQAVKAYHGRVLIRFAHEMDGYWFPWGMGHFNNTPTTFIKAWRHVWQIFQDVGATNARWVWSPNGCDCAKPTKTPTTSAWMRSTRATSTSTTSASRPSTGAATRTAGPRCSRCSSPGCTGSTP